MSRIFDEKYNSFIINFIKNKRLGMLIRYVRMTFQEDKIESFLEYFHQIKNTIRNVEGCRHLELQRDLDKPNILMTFSKWNSETDLNNYRDSDLFKTFWANTKVLFADKPMAFSVESVEVV